MATDKMGLRAELLNWYMLNSVLPAEGRRRISAATGVPVRTLEKIEQTGAFQYATLLRIALKAIQ